MCSTYNIIICISDAVNAKRERESFDLVLTS